MSARRPQLAALRDPSTAIRSSHENHDSINSHHRVSPCGAGAQGAGTVVSGYVNKSPGGIYLDGFGNLLAIDGTSGASALYVYSGCPSACKSHGPFSLATKGQVLYGSLNLGETRFMAVNTDGEIDVYQYDGT